MNYYRPYTIILVCFFLLSGINLKGQEAPKYSVYLIGDSGAPNLDGADEVFENLEKRISSENKNSAIIFLGDNVYHNGLPPKDRQDEIENRKEAEKKLLVQLKAIESFKGKIYFIPGNHDWNDAHPDGIDYIRAQEEYVEFFLDRGDVLIPDHGCPGPEHKKLGKNISLIAMDSQWWLHPHSEEQSENNDCKNKKIEDIMQELREMLDEHDDRQIIIALHHPIYSDGSHNGHYTLKDHFFPLTALGSHLWIPLPGLGSLYPFYRTTFGAKQDMPHPTYQRLRREILSVLEGRNNVVLASGHEHNLQYFFEKRNHFVKSGSGSKSAPLPSKTSALFSNKEKGYAKLEYFDDGMIKLKFYTVKDGVEVEKFAETIVEADLKFGKSYDEGVISDGSVSIKASELYDKGGLHKLIFGKLYREDWSTPVSFRNIDLSTEKGGLTPRKIGGGMSSKSIRLRDKDKKEYVLRSVEKGVAKVVPEIFQSSVVQDIFQDQIAASQPYAALIVPPLADAVGVYHTNPELVNLPRQGILGDYNDSYGNNLYLFEERPSGNQEQEDAFGNSRKIISYSDMIEKTRSSSKYHIHQEQVLRSRLLDIYLGDWDRHDDQWRWASFKEKDHDGGDETHIFYEPIPRDRDQVMFKYKGLMPAISKLLSPELRKFQTFGTDIKNVKYLAYNARHFDRNYLNELSRFQWLEIAEDMQEKLTDEVIDASMDRLPIEIQKLRGEEYQDAFRKRKEHLKEWAESHYEFLAKYVDVVGTNKNEFFDVKRKDDGSVEVIVYQITKDGSLDDQLYHRIFSPKETKEIRLYGLDGKDKFVVEGQSNKGPLVRVIGGKGNDELTDSSIIKGGRKSTIVYDKISDNGMDPGDDGLDERSDDFRVNEYDRKEFYYNSSIGIPFVGYNPDDGLVLQYSQALTTYGFRKSPYKSKHNIGLRYAANSNQFSVDYMARFTDVVGKADFGFDAFLHLPDNVSNFFGLTNERKFSVSDFEDFDFFRYERTDLKIQPSLTWTTPRQVSTISIAPYYRYVDVSQENDEFASDFEQSGLSDVDFDPSSFVGIELSYGMHKVDNPAYPTSGIHFQFEPSYNLNTTTKKNFTSLQASLTLYNYLWIPKPFVLATKIEAGINWGDFDFYQANYLGLSNGLRGFRQNRFGGRSSFVFSNDLRLRLGTIPGAFPLTIGLLGTYDMGRVWNDDEDFDVWHRSYGGGFFISPFDVMPISFYFSKSTEDTSNLLIKLGFAF